ncbi:PREDICTED: uncharacterized protein LOC108575211 [Habropoda laboriosa]|uniref:uncharacterized protein LOC108575211 n=1 Tax=Habropoda laboriosa TaxID=597456 RepID=UPI00083D33E0|nr:PREDICTED: uncharacterized protein LOC108575211 [Habropoda laboriosa]
MARKIKMEHLKSDIDLHVDNPTKNAENLIEWNVDMKVTVSNVKKSKMFQRSRTIVLFLLAIIFGVLLLHVRKEVRSLQIQVQSINVNLLLLMSKYDRLNRSLNRAWIHRSERFLENRNLHDMQRLLEEASSITKTIDIFDRIRNATNESSYTYNSMVQYLNLMRNLKGKYLLRGDAYSDSDKNSTTIPNSLTMQENNEYNLSDSTLRFERATLPLKKRNSMEKNIQSNHGKIQYDNDTNDYYNDEDLDVWREPRTRRIRRDEGRGKKRGKNKRRPKRSHRRLGPLVATFVGAIPEQHITDTVYIGPWVKSTKNDTQYSLNKFHLVEDKKSIEVTVTGLYMISAQIFYFGEPTNYSYWILLNSEGKSTTQKLVKCSTASSASATEVSCYTSVIIPLQRGDRVHIQQQERDRLINMREGHSYIQLVLLSNNTSRRRVR